MGPIDPGLPGAPVTSAAPWTPANPLPLAVLLSGGGTTLENLCQAIDRDGLPARVTRVVSSRADAFGIERARWRGIPVAVVPSRDFWRTVEPGAPGRPQRREPDWRAFSDALTPEIDAGGPGLVCLAGFLCRWLLPRRYGGRAMNIHPAPLPAFGGRGMHGLHAHAAVLASGARESGCTVHWVNRDYDAGPVILRRTCPVLPDDTPETLARRVAAEECLAYPEAIRLFAEGRLAPPAWDSSEPD